MSSPKISLAMIVRDEEENLGICLDSVARFVDEIVIVDTGSVDKTRDVATRFGASVYQFDPASHPQHFFRDTEEECQKFAAPGPYSGMWALGNFGAARQEAFSHASGDYTLWLDADDVLEHGDRLRPAVEDMHARGLAMGFLMYEYVRDAKGRVFYKQWRERIIRRGTGYWTNPVHEVFMPTQMALNASYEAPFVAHRRKADRKQVPHRNYKILLRQLWQLRAQSPGAPLDPRTLFYLGQEAKYIEPQRAVQFFGEYLRSSGWSEERAAAHMAVGELLELGSLQLPRGDALAFAQNEYAVAACEMPTNPDGLFGLARVAFHRQRWADCVAYCERGFQIGNTPSMLGANPMDRLYRPHYFYNVALAALGRLEEAAKSCRAALEALPEDPGVPGGSAGSMSANLTRYEEEIARQKNAAQTGGEMRQNELIMDKNEDIEAPPAFNIPRDAMVIWAIQLWKRLVSAGDLDRAGALLASLPPDVGEDPVVGRMVASTERRRGAAAASAVHRDIVFFLGPGVERWDPGSPDRTGLGGSETAAIEMARELAKLGRKVTVFAEAEGEFDGVEYVHFSRFHGARCEVFIASRSPWAIDQFGPVEADLKMLWVHDVTCGPNSPQMERWLYQFDRVLCLSEWHRGLVLATYPKLHPGRAVVTRNGIDPNRFRGGQGPSDPPYAAPKKENRTVFSSSPNRGLLALLHNFRFIRKEIPDAHVDIFYGFDTWETMARNANDQATLAEIARYRVEIDRAIAEGFATWHGRRPQKEVAAAFMRAKIWAYPTDFSETSCITAMEAQAAGAVPVCTKLAALGETVKNGILLEPDAQFGSKFVESCVIMMRDENQRAPIAQAARAWALKNFAWAAVAKDWNERIFPQAIAESKTNPIPAWRAA